MEQLTPAPEQAEIPVRKKPESHWYAVYTHSRAEKRVSERLTEEGIENFLPMQKTLRQWSDRKKLVEKPIISSYVFVRVVPKEFLTVRKTDGVVKIITLDSKPVVIPDDQMKNLHILCSSDVNVLVSDKVYLTGDLVAGNLRLPHRPARRTDTRGKKTQGHNPYPGAGNEPHSSYSDCRNT